jgi:curved DNA-binding protein CbpA
MSNSKKDRQSQPRKSYDDYVMDMNNNEASRQKMSYYEVLGADENASLTDIKKLFRQCAIDFHPDNKKTGDATLFALVARAYECLSDPEKRSEYDKMLLIERKTRKSTYLNQRKAFQEFINAQENEKDEAKSKLAKAKFDLDFVELDQKRGFDRKKYDEEKDNALSSKETSRRLDDLIAAREQDEIELNQRRIFNEGTWDPEKFNKLFVEKYKKGKGEIVKHGGAPSAFNDVGGASLYEDELYDEKNEDGYDNSLYSSLKRFDDFDSEITDDDIKRLKKMKGLKEYNDHSANRGRDYQDELEKRLKEREEEDNVYNDRKMKDFDTDNKMAGYGFLHEVGLNGRELEWEEEEVSDKTMKKLLEFRKNEKRRTKKK